MYIPAKYTEVLKNLIDNEQTKPLIDKAMGTYPIYTPIHKELYGFIPTREILNNKILNHYKYREIGFETVGRFIDELEISLNEIMPYYNQLYKSVDVMNGIDDIFGNVDITETFEEETEGSSSGNSTMSSTSSSESSNTSNTSASSESTANSQTSAESTNNSKNIKSSTPQSLLDVGTKNIDSVSYADEASWNEDISNSSGSSSDSANSSSTGSSTDTSNVSSENEGTSESSTTSTGKTTHTMTKRGNQGVNTYAHDMLEFRELFVNIEKQIIEDERISELFMRVY